MTATLVFLLLSVWIVIGAFSKSWQSMHDLQIRMLHVPGWLSVILTVFTLVMWPAETWAVKVIYAVLDWWQPPDPSDH